ncbi:threonine/serine dehydratase [Solicola gregarius]|uniref:threonine ammonia-lyase n=1 Tax=Solicola gregarius TaxID=2908642 RepID=A0AA46YLM0_9ACTN|nr:threonine/serine dehydratase [Solicola gregarius]UYM05729.1 threonine/serine dehydratase [Solicola gregarius]
MPDLDDLPARIDAARDRIAPYVRHTPHAPFPALSERFDADVRLKSEHLQVTGSFKARGALAKLTALDDDVRAAGVITASSGNHGLGVANALAALGGRGTVCVPSGASPVKAAGIRRLGAEVRTLGADAGETEVLAMEAAESEGLTYVSPYDDLDVISGQGTIGAEIVEQNPATDVVVVAVGGGGLVSGVATALKHRRPDVRVVGVSPANDAAMAASVEAGRIITVDAEPTLSDGTSGAVIPDAITFPLCQQLVDEWVLVSEDEIRDALRLVIDERHELIEGAAAAAVAGAVKIGDALAGRNVAIVSCGANIAAATLARALG